METDFDDFCPACNGSGEGLHDGSTCPACRGGGHVLDQTEADNFIHEWDFDNDN